MKVQSTPSTLWNTASPSMHRSPNVFVWSRRGQQILRTINCSLYEIWAGHDSGVFKIMVFRNMTPCSVVRHAASTLRPEETNSSKVMMAEITLKRYLPDHVSSHSRRPTAPLQQISPSIYPYMHHFSLFHCLIKFQLGSYTSPYLIR
jgi:hypothetical protein